jgi:pimeloyl-ACP methyl ester carboxylesterase
MKTKTVLFSLLFILSFFTVTAITQSSFNNNIPYGSNSNNGKYAKVNNIKMYYEIYGKGEPLVLIHGNGESIKSMKNQIDYFSKYYKVIVADSRGHGKSELGNVELTYEQMANDWASLLTYLKIDSANIIGWSDGGIIGLLMAIHHKQKVKMLAAMGANLQPDSTAVYPWAINWVKQNRIKINEMIAKGDTTENWELQSQYFNLLDEQPNIPLEDLHKITAPVLVLAGDKDVIKEEHTVLIYQNIPKAQLCIFPAATHMIPVVNPIKFNTTVYEFFSKPFSRPDTKDFFE